MSDSKGDTTQTVGRGQPVSKPGVGIIIRSGTSEKVARTILRAKQRDHHVLVTSAEGSETEAMEFAEQLGATIVSPEEASGSDELETAIASTAKSLGLPGVILQSASAPRIDYDGSRDKLESGAFSVEAKPIDREETSAESNYTEESVVAIIPAYNEAETLSDIITATAPFVDDVIVIDDASTDETKTIADEFADSVISHPKNMGVGGAVHTGYQAAIRTNYDVVIQIDGDGQHDPSYIPEMLDTMEERDADMVIGSRWLNDSYQDYSLVRRLGIKFFTAETNLLGGLDITDVTSGFRAYRTPMLKDLGRPANSHWALEQTLEAARKNYTIEEVSVPMPPETDGSQFDFETFLKYPPRMMLTTIKILIFK